MLLREIAEVSVIHLVAEVHEVSYAWCLNCKLLATQQRRLRDVHRFLNYLFGWSYLLVLFWRILF